jgi:predicted peptidase
MFSFVQFLPARARDVAAACSILFLLIGGHARAQDLVVPPADGAAPANPASPPVTGNTPRVDELGGGVTSTMPSAPQPKVAKRDEPRNQEPMEEATEFFERKVFAVPDSRPGKTLTYFFKPPAAYQPQDKMYPLVIVLHDEDGVGNAAEYLAQKAARKNFPAFIAVPVLPNGPIWAFPSKLDDAKKTDRNMKKEQALPDLPKLVETLAKDNPSLDLNRVYLVGCGEGGYGVFGGALKFPQIFAGGVAISGGWALRDAPKLRNMPLFVIHGDSDKENDPALSQNLAFYIQQAGGRKISFMSVPGMGHDCSNPYVYNNAVWAWLFKQRL